jgi:hypothetical protein
MIDAGGAEERGEKSFVQIDGDEKELAEKTLHEPYCMQGGGI